MASDAQATLKAEVTALLASAGDGSEVVRGLVRRLDLHHVSAVERGDEAARRWVGVALARATYALAPLLAARHPGARQVIEATAEAALDHATGPTTETARVFFEAATASYPLGPGDGCLAVAELGGHDARGSGCSSGAGFLDEVASAIGADEVVTALRHHGLW